MFSPNIQILCYSQIFARERFTRQSIGLKYLKLYQTHLYSPAICLYIYKYIYVYKYIFVRERFTQQSIGLKYSKLYQTHLYISPAIHVFRFGIFVMQVPTSATRLSLGQSVGRDYLLFYFIY